MTPSTQDARATGLVELAERVEAATGAALILDRDVALLLYPDAKPLVGNDSRISVWDGNGRTQLTVKPYTASLDAAMTLVPKNWKLRQANFSGPCTDDRKWHLNLHGGREGENTFVGRGATPALALTAAALRALAASTKDQPHDA